MQGKYYVTQNLSHFPSPFCFQNSPSDIGLAPPQAQENWKGLDPGFRKGCEKRWFPLSRRPARISGLMKKGGPWLTVLGKPCLTYFATGFLRVCVCPRISSWSAAGPSFYFNSCVCFVEHSLENAAIEIYLRCLQTFLKL